MRLGWYISGAGHLALILLVLFGGLFAGDRIPEAVVLSEVSILSEEEFAALSAPEVAPETQSDAPDVAVPEEDSSETPAAPTPDSAPVVAAPEPVEAPETPDEPEFEVEQPVPEAVVVDDAPEVQAPPSDLDGTVSEPDAVAAPAPRVAPVPQVAPPPDAETGPELVEDTAPDPEAPPEEPVEEDTPVAPEAASDRIVTEAEEEQNYAPASSRRPRARPARPVRVAEDPPETPSPETPRAAPNTNDAVADALRNDQPAPAPAPAPVPSGPPLTGGEKEAFVLAVSSCWNVGSLSTEALGTTVIVAFDMQQTGQPVTNSIRMVSFSGGSEGGARQAFEAARRAIIRCGARGFDLPAEKYDQWREIEATFNPQGMQFR